MNLKCVTLNTKLLSFVMHYDDTSTYPWQDSIRVKLLSDYLINNDFDIICIQEVWSEILRYQLNKALKKAGYYTIPKSGKPWWNFWNEDSGLFYASKYPWKSNRFVVFDHALGADSWANKGVLNIVTNINGVVFDLYNTHLNASSNAAHTRTYQLQTIANMARQNGKDGPATLIMGDLNVKYGTEEYKSMLNLLGSNCFCVNCRDVLVDSGHGEDYTFDTIENASMMCADDKNNPYKCRFDYVLHLDDGDSGIKSINSYVDKFELHHNKHKYLSDHYGIVTNIRI